MSSKPEHRRNRLRRLFRTSDGRRASTIRPRRRFRIVLEGLRGEASVVEPSSFHRRCSPFFKL